MNDPPMKLNLQGLDSGLGGCSLGPVHELRSKLGIAESSGDTAHGRSEVGSTQPDTAPIAETNLVRAVMSDKAALPLS